MFKKTLAAAAILGAFAGSAFAADVTLYGVVDYALDFTSKSVDGADDVNTFSMKSGQQAGNRWGLKGVEDLGNGLKVGFVLESGFDADTGSLNNDDRLFGRESIVYLDGAFGQVAFGRTSQLAAGAGSYALAGSAFNSFSTGWGGIGSWGNVTDKIGTRLDNSITYKTPTFAGLTVYAQYSFKNDSTKSGDENKATSDRTYGIGATYKLGDFSAVAIVDSVNYAAATNYEDDSLGVTLGAAYNFGVAKVFLNGRYFDNAQKFSAFELTGANLNSSSKYSGVEGYGINLGADIPAFGGTAKVQFGYGHGESDLLAGEKAELDVYAVSAGYIYNLSKRTAVYAAADYKTGDYNEAAGVKDVDQYEVLVGMTHKF